MSNLRGVAALALALALSWSLAPIASAQEANTSPISVTVRGIGGQTLAVRARAFATLHVTLANSSDEDVRGTLRAYRVDQRGSDTPSQGLFYEKVIDLPRKGKRVELLYYYVQEGEPANQLCVAFEAEGEVEQPTPAYPPIARFPAMQVLILSRPGLADAVKRTFHGTRVPGRLHFVPTAAVIGEAEALPDHPAGYDPFGAVVLAEAELPPDRVPALLEWTASGGDLWVIASGGRATIPKPIAAVLPGTSKGDIKRRIDGLQRLAGYAQPMTRASDTVLLDRFEPWPEADLIAATSDEVQADQSVLRHPLIVRGRYGAGYVTYLTFPLDAGPVSGWPGMSAIVGSLLRLPLDDGDVDDGVPPDPPLEELSLNLSEALESLEPPSSWTVAPLLILYVLLVGPLNFFVLSRAKKLSFAQVVAGLVALIFGLLFYAIGVLYKGSESLVTQVGFVDLAAAPDQASGVEVTTGFFSTERGQTEATGPKGALVGPLASRKSTRRTAHMRWDEDHTELERVALDTWALRRFRSRRTASLGHVEVRLQLTENGLVGTIDNRTSQTFLSPTLLMENCVVNLNDIPANQKVTVDVVPQVRPGRPVGIPDIVRYLVKDSGGDFTAHYGLGLQGVSVSGDPYDGNVNRRLLASFQRRLARVPYSPGCVPALLLARSESDPGGLSFSGGAKTAIQRTILVHEARVRLPSGQHHGLRQLPPRVYMCSREDGGRWLPTSGTTGTPPILERSLGEQSPSYVIWRWQLPVEVGRRLTVKTMGLRWRTEPELGELDPKSVDLQYVHNLTGRWTNLADLKKVETSEGEAIWPRGDPLGRTHWSTMVHPNGQIYVRLRNLGFKSITVRAITLNASFEN